MKTALVGYTGFVGSNIAMKHRFGGLYNSKNINEAFGTKPDLLVYAGVPAAMYLANMDPRADLNVIKNAIENIERIQAKRIVLISTICVLDNPIGVDENSIINEEKLTPYGRNRFMLEKWIKENCSEHLIVRLPALYGANIKKNFIFDYVNVIPSMLSEKKMDDFLQEDDILKHYYTRQENGFYKCNKLSKIERDKLKEYFKKSGFSALNFTDSRAKYQFYNLANLWDDINIALENKIETLHMAIEPVAISELYKFLTNGEFINEIATVIPNYDYRTRYAQLFGKSGNYIRNKTQVMEDIKKFIMAISEN